MKYIIVTITLIFLSCESTSSRHAAHCNCREEMFGEVYRLSPIENQGLERLFDMSLQAVGLNPYSYTLCQARMSHYAGVAFHGEENRKVVILNGEHLNLWEKYDYYYKVFLLGHEVGHHWWNHMIKPHLSHHMVEQQANAIAGFVLARLGASYEEAIGIFPSTASAPSGEPSIEEQNEAIAKGWLYAQQHDSPHGLTI